LLISYTDITSHIEEIYQVSISTATPFVWLDAIHYKIKDGGKYVSKAVYTVLGVNMEGKKDILIASADGLKGFQEGIKAIFPKTEVQLCIIYQIRNSIRYVASKNHKEFMKDLKPVYKAVSKEVAEEELKKLDEKWRKLYPIVLQSWKNKWENLSVYFKYPLETRKVIYITYIIESVHRQFRKLTKTKGAFPNENSLLKLLFMGIQNATKEWNMPMWNWNLTLSQLAIFFEGRLDDEFKI